MSVNSAGVDTGIGEASELTYSEFVSFDFDSDVRIDEGTGSRDHLTIVASAPADDPPTVAIDWSERRQQFRLGSDPGLDAPKIDPLPVVDLSESYAHGPVNDRDSLHGDYVIAHELKFLRAEYLPRGTATLTDSQGRRYDDLDGGVLDFTDEQRGTGEGWREVPDLETHTEDLFVFEVPASEEEFEFTYRPKVRLTGFGIDNPPPVDADMKPLSFALDFRN